MTNSLMFLGNLGTGEIIIIALVVLLLFGGKKIPELMRGIGKGVKSFKDGMNDIEKQINPKRLPPSRTTISNKNIITPKQTKSWRKCQEDPF